LIANLTVPVLNNYDLLQRMVSPIDYPIAHLLIIDNGRELDNLEVPSCIKQVSIFPVPSNLGVATSWNLGIKAFSYCPVFFFASADMFYNPGDLELLATASPQEITLHREFPNWQTFAIGEDVVQKIGLFDESLHPIYFEDTDYLRRAAFAGVSVIHKNLTGGHNNSSTIAKDKHYSQRNSETFLDNKSYYDKKVASGDLSEGRWLIERARKNTWAK
jgi:GT2 family glycosyltransferase